uniref:Uncharacterized protein n=1 Tax=Anguilla anguilla TaxID=7936 RepID=A0A0E9RM44_ANGAN
MAATSRYHPFINCHSGYSGDVPRTTWRRSMYVKWTLFCSGGHKHG